jgi:DNA (cytosine-5)-methyltransferase 1
VETGQSQRYRIVGLFAGIGGLEAGLHAAGHEARLLCEVWEPAQAVLRARFPGLEIAPDVQELRSLPDDADVITAGFPCTDLSQAGRTAGINGSQSGLVAHVFRLADRHDHRWLILENVRNMLALDAGRAMHYLVSELEDRGYDWAYRLVDSRFTGVPQRRQRVLLVASRSEDPRDVLLSDDAGQPGLERYASDAFGFYWTEGLRGLGWAQDAVPTLKGGSTIGIPSPPAVWLPDAPAGRQLVTPSVEDAEALQGFPRDWTSAAGTQRKKGARWKLAGNAVTVGVAAWLGRRLADPGSYDPAEAEPLEDGDRWPTAAWGRGHRRWRSRVSMWPEVGQYTHLRDVLDEKTAVPLSYRAAAGFFDRTQHAKLRFDQEFILAVKQHVEMMAPTALTII